MSCYIEVFVRSKSGEFTCIGSFSRNSAIYKCIDDCHCAPWEKVKKIFKQDISDIINVATGYIDSYKDYIAENKAEQELIMTANNSLEEKLEAIRNCQNTFVEIKEELDEYEHAKDYFYFLSDIISEFFYEDADSLKGLYFGMEIGEPTEEDIV